MLDFGRENALVHFVLILFSSIATIKILDYLIEKDYTNGDLDHFQSSIWCFGSNYNERRCRAVNLCYESNHQSFIFIKGPTSVESGLPEDLHRPCLVSISSLPDHNQYYFNYITIGSNFFTNLSAKYDDVKMVAGSTFIFGRFKPDNLMHSLHDDILPLKWTLTGLGLHDDGDAKKRYNLFTYDEWPFYSEINFNQQLYQKIFNFNQIFAKSMADNKLICFQETWIGLDRETTWYQYGFKSPQGPLNKTPSQITSIQRISSDLRNLLRSKTCPNGRYGVFIARTTNRLVLNEDELISHLQETLPMIKIEMNQGNSIMQMIEKVACASLLIGMHGSALVLSIFLPPGSSLIELFPYGINPDHYTHYKTLASHLGLIYQSWVNRQVGDSRQHPEYPPILGGIDHLSETEKAQIKPLEQELEQNFCCDDPNWLYRIYQDTRVNIDHFTKDIDLNKINLTSSSNSKPIFQPFFPGPVKNIGCKYQPEHDVYRIDWQKPWNLEYNDVRGEVSFEILVDNGDGRGFSMFTSTNFITMSRKERDSFSFWVRCLVDQRKGPFKFSFCSKD